MYRITPQGQSSTIFEPQELQVQALAVDKNGVVYAATNPDGKVYRIERAAAKRRKAESGEGKIKAASEYLLLGVFRSWNEIHLGSGFR